MILTLVLTALRYAQRRTRYPRICTTSLPVFVVARDSDLHGPWLQANRHSVNDKQHNPCGANRGRKSSAASPLMPPSSMNCFCGEMCVLCAGLSGVSDHDYF